MRLLHIDHGLLGDPEELGVGFRRVMLGDGVDVEVPDIELEHGPLVRLESN